MVWSFPQAAAQTQSFGDVAHGVRRLAEARPFPTGAHRASAAGGGCAAAFGIYIGCGPRSARLQRPSAAVMRWSGNALVWRCGRFCSARPVADWGAGKRLDEQEQARHRRIAPVVSSRIMLIGLLLLFEN